MMKVPVGNGLYAIVDNEDYEKVSTHNWCLNNYGYVWRKRKDSEQDDWPSSHILLHRWILGIKDKCVLVDHRDRNPLKNIKENLRIANKSYNSMNSKPNRENSTTGYKGVSFRKDRGKYQSYIHKNGKKINLGTFSEPEKAALAYNQAAVELFGEYACLNIINPKES
jgi:hypothetical protein